MKTTISLHGEAAEWVSALPKGRRGPYVMHLLNAPCPADWEAMPVERGGMLLRVSLRMADDVAWSGVGGRSRFVQQLVEARMQQVSDAMRLSQGLVERRVGQGKTVLISLLGEERAFGRSLEVGGG